MTSTALEPVVVDTPSGAVRGRVHADGDVVEFLGLPYARAARFAPPEPEPPWEGVRDARTPAPQSPQLASRMDQVAGPSDADELGQDEDCLAVTVRAPLDAVPGAGLPVLVWIHGGAYVIGGASLSWYDTARLVREGHVVTVSVGYRLGVLGWLRRAGVSPGNLGLLDLAAALHWIRDHVAAFGGDPGAVTLVGESAGAHAIACLMSVPRYRPLFARVILQSGQFGLGLGTERTAARVAGFVDDALRELAGPGADPRTVDVGTLLRAQKRTMIRHAGPGGVNSAPAFAPVAGIDPLVGVPAGDPWVAAAHSGHPMIIGTTADETNTFVRIAPPLAALERRLPGLVGLGSRFLTQRVFAGPADRLATRAAAAGTTVSTYRFSWRAPDSGLGACHTIELPFLFGNRAAWQDAPMLAGASWDDDVEPLGRALRRHWLGFACERIGSS
ncbi:carboxylesterase family protein [Actinomycetospora sp. TBRC 11914]|uniref:carboxylesterase family protein n=1 Tax=Actinomycetospora sp. TBRC 11914 TaxID=2729387 RepID=UPI00145D6415|nr:carboxylesterase family protein [Actinomycetospora sp. TBRC 11914]NMO93609.1 carboxylesterase/lipase family protein [Actinomycetospora sp. TBRC 11914]